MTKTELTTRVVSNTGRSDKIGIIPSYLDDALLEVSRIHPWDDLRREVDIAVALGATQTQLPPDVSQIIELRLITPSSPTLSFPMELHRKAWFVGKFPNVEGSTISGRPLYCYKEGNQLKLDRHSNGVYAIRVTYFAFGKFDTTSDESPIQNVDELLVAFATAQVYRSVQMYGDATYWDGRYHALAKSAVNAEEREVGVRFVAEEWNRKSPVQTNQPWLDPFSGHQS